jgi:hypothetical protein
MVGVVPPGDPVVQVECVARDVHEERGHDEGEGRDWDWLGSPTPARVQQPRRRNDEHQQWVGEEPRAEALAGELGKVTGEGAYRQLRDGGNEDGHHQPLDTSSAGRRSRRLHLHIVAGSTDYRGSTLLASRTTTPCAKPKVVARQQLPLWISPRPIL